MTESSPKWGENAVGKEEMAHYKQFFLFQQCFQRLIVSTMFCSLSKANQPI